MNILPSVLKNLWRKESTPADPVAVFSKAFARIAKGKPVRPLSKKALFVGSGGDSRTQFDLVFMLALYYEGYEISVVTWDEPRLLRWYELLPQVHVHFWHQFQDPINEADIEKIFSEISSTEKLIEFEAEGVRVGAHSLNLALRELRRGLLDWKGKDREEFTSYLRRGFEGISIAKNLLAKVNPDVAVFGDGCYPLQGSIFDLCIARGTRVIQTGFGHKSNRIALKGRTYENKTDYTISLSEVTWKQQQKRTMPEQERVDILNEILASYDQGDWWNLAWKPNKTQNLPPEGLREVLRLDSRPVRIIYCHSFYDAPVAWGPALHDSYQDWFMDILPIAKENTDWIWIFKFHPANTFYFDGKISEDPLEKRVIERELGSIPDHFRLVPENTDIHPHSLLRVAQQILTVRGTIGMEACLYGVPVVTAGKGPYSGKGFTTDPKNRQAFLEILADRRPPEKMSEEQVRLAYIYTHEVLVNRLLSCEAFQMQYHGGRQWEFDMTILSRDPASFRSSPEIRKFVEWVESDKEDYINVAEKSPGNS